jgi:SNF family Na+-dependent transporter
MLVSKKDQNVTMDAYIISFFDLVFSICSGFVVFQILGYMAFTQQVPIAKVTQSGFGLAFIAFPQAVATMPLSNIFSILIFTTLISLGLSSGVALVEGASGILSDAFPKVPKFVIALVVCVVGFIMGIPYTLHNGYYFLDLVDYFVSSYCLVGAGLLGEKISILKSRMHPFWIPHFRAISSPKAKRYFIFRSQKDF